MQYRPLGKTGIRTPILSLGTGGPSLMGQKSNRSQSDQNALVRYCLDNGINLFDTAPIYLQSEKILGKALKTVPRESYVLVTKWVPNNHTDIRKIADNPELMIESINKSLKRLQTDYIDVMLFHGVMPEIYDLLVERFYETSAKLKETGKIRFLGLSTRIRDDLKQETALRALELHNNLWDVIMVKYGILNQYASKKILPLALRHNVGVINMAAIRVKLHNPELLVNLVEQWKKLGYIAENSLSQTNPLDWLINKNVNSIASAGYKFAADHPAISSVLTGTSSIKNLNNNIAALEQPYLRKSDSDRLKKLFGDIVEYA